MTERKQAEQAVLDSEEKFRSVIEQSRDGMLLADERGYIVEWNRGLEEIMGRPRAQMLGRRVDQSGIHSAMSSQQIMTSFQRLQTATDQAQLANLNRLIEGDVTRPDGTRRSLQIMLFPIHLEKTAMLCAIIRDITERMRIEHDLRESESFYHSLVEVLPQPLCRKDLAGRFTFANQRFCDQHRLTLEQLIGLTDFDLHPAELAARYRADDQRVVDLGQVVDHVEEHATLDGQRTYVQVVKAPIRVGDTIIGVQIMYWDVTERRRAEEALRDSEARFRQIAENIHEVFWMSDAAANRSLYVSPGTKKSGAHQRYHLTPRLIHPDGAS